MSGRPSAPVVGVGAVVWRGDKLLLIRRGHAPRKGAWSLPGGRQELGETVEQTCLRELREETGVEVRLIEIAAVVDLIERDARGVASHYTVVDFAAEWISGEARAGGDADEVAWAARDDLARYELTAKTIEVIALAAAKRGLR